MPSPPTVRPVLASVDRESRARLLAALTPRFGDFDLAEGALQEALTRALSLWPETGIPRVPEAWLMRVAGNAALDSLRREQTATRKAEVLGAELERRGPPKGYDDPAAASPESAFEAVPDERLALFFACAHPALRLQDRIALTLRYVAGLTTVEVAHALLLPITTMQQRLSRAKLRIRKLGISFEMPEGSLLLDRLPQVRRVIFLLYSEGFARSTGEQHVRDDLTQEALRLARLLQTQGPRSAESIGLLGLMLLTEARRPARLDEEGRPIPLSKQDRALWSRELLADGLALAEEGAAMPDAGSYAIQCAIAAVHAESASFDATDWRQIAVLYRLLEAREPSPLVRLGSAVALGRALGPEHGIRLLDELGGDSMLDGYRGYHAARAITLEELGDHTEAASAYRRALQSPGNEAEQQLLLAALAEL